MYCYNINFINKCIYKGTPLPYHKGICVHQFIRLRAATPLATFSFPISSLHSFLNLPEPSFPSLSLFFLSLLQLAQETSLHFFMLQGLELSNYLHPHLVFKQLDFIFIAFPMEYQYPPLSLSLSFLFSLFLFVD